MKTLNQHNNLVKSALKKCQKAFFFALFFSFLISIFTLAVSIYSMQVLDRVLTSSSIETLIFLSIITITCLVFLGLLTAFRSFIFLEISNWLDEVISPILLDNSIDENAQNKALISQNLRDLTQIKSFISSNNMSVFFDAPFALIYLIFIFFIHPINGLITVIGAIILLKMAFLNEKITKKSVEEVQDLQSDVNRDFAVISSNSEAIKAMGMKKTIIKRWLAGNEKLRSSSAALSKKSSSMTAIIKSIRMAIQVITMASSAILVIYNKMSSGGIIATSILSGKALAPFDAAVSLWKSFILAKKSYKNLNESIIYDESRQKKIKLPKIKGEVSVEKLIYKQKDSENILLKSLSFKLKPGQSLAIIGKSGSGKTTLARILVGVLAASSGSVRIDGADLSGQNFDEIGDSIGYLPQDVELLSGLVKENISRAENDDEKTIAAAKFCQIHEMILSLKNGYETMIEKGGVNLSGGQRQLIALARAFYGDVKFALLDEPNSNLDSIGEANLNSIIKKAKENGVTLIIITHKPSIAANCDKIMLLEDGQIKLFDDAKKVLEASK